MNQNQNQNSLLETYSCMDWIYFFFCRNLISLETIECIYFMHEGRKANTRTRSTHVSRSMGKRAKACGPFESKRPMLNERKACSTSPMTFLSFICIIYLKKQQKQNNNSSLYLSNKII